jgi:hypothetical protein
VTHITHIKYRDFDPQRHLLPIAAQDIPDAAAVIIDDENEDGLPLVWIASPASSRPIHGIALAAKANMPILIMVKGWTPTRSDEDVEICVVRRVDIPQQIEGKETFTIGAPCPVCGKPVTIEEFARKGAIYAGDHKLAHRQCWLDAGNEIKERGE